MYVQAVHTSANAAGGRHANMLTVVVGAVNEIHVALCERRKGLVCDAYTLLCRRVRLATVSYCTEVHSYRSTCLLRLFRAQTCMQLPHCRLLEPVRASTCDLSVVWRPLACVLTLLDVLDKLFGLSLL